MDYSNYEQTIHQPYLSKEIKENDGKKEKGIVFKETLRVKNVTIPIFSFKKKKLRNVSSRADFIVYMLTPAYIVIIRSCLNHRSYKDDVSSLLLFLTKLNANNCA